MPTANPRPASPRPARLGSPKPASPKPSKAKKAASPKATGSKEAKAKAEEKVAALQEHVTALQSELELARVQLVEQHESEQPSSSSGGLLPRLMSDHHELLLNLQQLRPVTAREGALHRISALRSFLASTQAVSEAANAVLEEQLSCYDESLANDGPPTERSGESSGA